jgi:chromosomal replication initiation ATPase DnaA
MNPIPPQQIIGPDRPRTAALAQRIIESCAFEWDVRPDLVTSKQRDSWIVVPRHAAMALMRERGMTLSEIGKILGRHYASVIHGVRENRRRADHCRKHAEKFENVRNLTK